MDYYASRAQRTYEVIHNPETVDLIVSLCYSVAAEGVLDEPLPKGIALRFPDKVRIALPKMYNNQGRRTQSVQLTQHIFTGTCRLPNAVRPDVLRALRVI
ncbi:hypothetical protein B0H14DRAFT_3425555 [Mycena olivaceomarginata]|nr:hypothetical protein B0H14DRAFT_3425555 [Mycena olivaceomarginata]